MAPSCQRRCVIGQSSILPLDVLAEPSIIIILYQIKQIMYDHHTLLNTALRSTSAASRLDELCGSKSMAATDPPSTAGTQSSDMEKGAGSATNGVATPDKNRKSGTVRTGDKSNEALVIPKNRLVIVFIGLMLTVFLAALDQTIVCTHTRGKFGVDLYSHGAADDCQGFERRTGLCMGRNELFTCLCGLYSSLWTC